KAPEEKVRVVFSRPGFSLSHRHRAKVVQFPVLIIAIYRALPSTFAQNLVDFDRFLGSITVENSRGYVGRAATAPPTPGPSATVSAAPAPQPAASSVVPPASVAPPPSASGSAGSPSPITGF